MAQNLLDMSEVGVLLVGEMHPSKPGRAKDRLALIGRVCARVESVDFNALFKRYCCTLRFVEEIAGLLTRRASRARGPRRALQEVLYAKLC